MARIAVGEIPAGLSEGARALQRDTPKDAKPDPKAGMWVKFQGSRSTEWLPLGNFSLTQTKGSDESTAFVDVLVTSPKGLHLGEAFDAEEHITVLMEERQHQGSPHRQTFRDAAITSISVTDEVNPTRVDPTGTYDLTTKRRVVRVGLRLKDTAPPSH